VYQIALEGRRGMALAAGAEPACARNVLQLTCKSPVAGVRYQAPAAMVGATAFKQGRSRKGRDLTGLHHMVK
jgi:hypothetical protein